MRYDDHAMHITDQDRFMLDPQLMVAHQDMETLRASGSQGFFDLPFDTASAVFLTKKAAAWKKCGFKHLLVIGIGGSNLGARALCALGRPKTGMDISFISMPDPDAVAGFLHHRAWLKETGVYVVSKSGTTIETLSIFLTVRAALIKAVGAKKHAGHMLVTTDQTEHDPLLALARAEGYEVIPHPLNVGGRFSVLSSVGLFPAACQGMDIQKILAGARAMEETRRVEGAHCLPARFAANHILSIRAGRTIHVLMPYAQSLHLFGFWYRQLWAESLGKQGKGPTPIAALGPEDQHSQIQLYHDGPQDKTVTFIETERFHDRVIVPHIKADADIASLGGLQLADMMHAERAGTAEALGKADRPHGTIFLPDLSPKSIGALLQFFMLATVYAASLLGVNPFNQPGVEEGKKAVRRLLKRPETL